MRYYFKSGNQHDIHSPFIFDFYNSVFKNKKINPCFDSIEEERRYLIKSKDEIEVTDFGAGSKKKSSKFRRISDIARYSLKSKKWAEFLFNLIQKYNYINILDLGTSLGITTAYLAKANPNANVFTFDGCNNCLSIAKKNFEKLEINNVKIIEGNIDITLLNIVETLNQIDLVFFDANHQYSSTMEYFELCLGKSRKGTCFVFDDIYWSDGMKKAWKEITQNNSVTFSIDLFYVGVVFVGINAEKQHFVLK